MMPVTWGFLANDRACRPAAGLSGMVSMVTLERGNDQNQVSEKGFSAETSVFLSVVPFFVTVPALFGHGDNGCPVWAGMEKILGA